MDFKRTTTKKQVGKSSSGKRGSWPMYNKNMEGQHYYDEMMPERRRDGMLLYGAEQGRAGLRPIVSDALKEVDFDETHYLSAGVLLKSLYVDSNPSDDSGLRNCIKEICSELSFETENDSEVVYYIMDSRRDEILNRCPQLKERVTEMGVSASLKSFYAGSNSSDDLGLRNCIREICSELSFETENDFWVAYLIMDNRGEEIFLRYPQLKEEVTKTGNCGAMANFLFERKEDETSKGGNFGFFIEELGKEVHEDKVKLINVQANTEHAFTLICYRQHDVTVVELIQAWQGKYSVKESLNNAQGNIYDNHELANMFRIMHDNLQGESGRRYYNRIFLIGDIKDGVENFDIKYVEIKILDESPESYAGRMVEKGMSLWRRLQNAKN